MTILYQPPIANLGIMAPVLGPWFGGAGPIPVIPALATGGAAPTQLHVQITLQGDWLPPATGNLSLFYIQNSAVPPMLDNLRNVDGSNPFEASGIYGGDTRLVAYFQLLPEVELRLHQCMGLMPAPTSNPLAAAPVAGVPTRPQVHSFMLVFPNNTVFTSGFIDNLFSGMLDMDADPSERPNCVGLTVDGAGNINGNMALPMTHLRRPGGGGPLPDKLLNNVPNVNLDLWCFDRRGRPIDPGAVACWWSWLLNYGIGENPGGSGQFQLMAPGVAGAMANPGAPVTLPGAAASSPQVANFAAGLTVHLVDPHEGPLGAPFIGVVGDTVDTNNVQRLNVTVGGAAAAPAANVGLVNGGATGVVALGFTPAPTVPFPAPTGPVPAVNFNPPADNAPLPRMAVLPAGPYGAGPVTLWPGGPLDVNLTRDFVRVAVVDEEAFLTGVRRRRSEDGPPQPNFSDSAGLLPIQLRREMDQNRPSTRITVGASTGPVLRTTSSAVATAMLALPSTGASPARLILGVTDTAWGDSTPPAGMPAGTAATSPFPATLALSSLPATQALPDVPGYRVLPLVGDGGDEGGRQLVLVEFDFGPGTACAGGTVRAWPLGFSFGTGDHMRLTGGFATIAANNLAWLVMELPAGRVDHAGQMRMDLLVTIPDGNGGTIHRRYASLPFQRPAPVGGAPLAGNPIAPYVICEAGLTGNPGVVAAASVPAGAHVVQLGAAPQLIDRASIGQTSWIGTLANYLSTGGATALVSLTEPAFLSTPDRADAAGRALPKQVTGGGTPAFGASGPGGGVATLAGGRLHLLGRSIGDSASASLPLGLMDRKEVVGATLSGGPRAVIGSAPPVPWGLEPATNHFLAFPGVPASIETHGTGAVLAGDAALPAYEYALERSAGLSIAALQGIGDAHVRSAVFQSEPALAVEAAMNPLPAPAPPAGPTPVVAVLRTSAVGVEGLPLVGRQAVVNNVYPTMTQVLNDFYTWLNTLPPLPGGVGPAGTWLSNQNPPAANALAVTRALDRRIQSAAFGSRESLNALMAAIGRAQDLVYIETPELDNLVIESGDGDPAKAENLQWWQALIDRMTACIGLRVVLCVSTLPAQGAPDKLRQVRDKCLLDAVTAMRNAHGSRFAMFSPGVGGGRALRLASSSVVIDDAWALTGSTHLSRRGLSWDASLAAAVFDENVVDGRPADVQAFRNGLLADRLGIPVRAVPIDAAELVRAINDLDARGSQRLSAGSITPPATAPTAVDIDVWNPDGSRSWETLTTGDFATNLAQALALTNLEHAMVEG